MLPLRIWIVKLLQRTKLNKISNKIYYRYFHGFNTANRSVLPTIDRCFQKAMELETVGDGDYYEFGLFKGYSFWYAQKVAENYGLNKMRFFGFDSFAGFPKVQGRDKTKYEIFYEGQYACPKEGVIKSLESKGIDWNKTFLIEGFFESSLNEEKKRKYRMGKIAIALIDCDLYSSTVEVLNFINKMIMDKSILIFDDWNCFDEDDERGQRKAFREFLEKNDQLSAQGLFSYGLYGQVFIINLSSGS